jgi:hypothetical protein
MANIRACLTPGPQTQRALAREHRFARSGWARVPAAVIAAVGGSLGIVASEVGGLPVQVAVVGALALGAWWLQPRLERVCRYLFWRTPGE